MNKHFTTLAVFTGLLSPSIGGCTRLQKNDFLFFKSAGYYLQVLLCLVLITILTGCKTTIHSGKSDAEIEKDKHTAALNSWMGSSKNSLLQSWGPPTRTTDDGKGGEILSYEKRSTLGFYLYGQYMENTAVNFTDMFIDASGKIYYWRTGAR